MKKLNVKKNIVPIAGGLIVLIATASAAFPCILFLGQPKLPDELRKFDKNG